MPLMFPTALSVVNYMFGYVLIRLSDARGF